MEVQKISAGTIARLVLLLLALVNSALTAAGKSPIPIDEEGVQQFITLAFLGITSLWAYWKNNDITKKHEQKRRITEKRAFHESKALFHRSVKRLSPQSFFLKGLRPAFSHVVEESFYFLNA